MSQPGFFFYTGDWLKDTRVLSPALRGAWIDLLCVLHENSGEITWTLDDLSTFWTVERREGDAFVTALSRLNIANVTRESHDTITIVCRKMKRAVNERESNRLRKQKQRERQGRYRASHGAVPSMSLHPSSSESSSSSYPDHKNEAPPDPPKPKKELDPTVKLWADKVYQSNPAKFRKLIVWIKECEKFNFTPVMVAMALERFFPYRDQIDQWYPYLDKLVKKAEGDINRDQHLLEHEQHKEEVRQASKILKRFNGA